MLELSKNWKYALIGFAILVLLLLGIGLALIFTRGGEDSKPTPPKVPTDPYQVEGLKLHNKKRAIHHSPPLVLSKELNDIALRCAKHYMKQFLEDPRKVQLHDCEMPSLGENIGRGKIYLNASEATKKEINKWYDESTQYNFDSPPEGDATEDTRYFTQVVWKNTKELGIAHVGEGKDYFVVGIYDPRGNRDRGYADNVLKP